MHAFLALAPSYAMALQSPRERQALPVLKVVARNAGCIHGPRLRGTPRLQPVAPATLPKGRSGGWFVGPQDAPPPTPGQPVARPVPQNRSVLGNAWSGVKDLVAGSGIEFDERGEQQLRGVPGEWSLFAAAR